MDILSIILIAIGLSMDAFAVSVTNGIIIKDIKMGHALKIGLYFGAFQAVMPIIGWLAESQFEEYIISIDHWIAFVMLAFIGGKMIWEAYGAEDNETETVEEMCEVAVSKQNTVCEDPLRIGRLIVV